MNKLLLTALLCFCVSAYAIDDVKHNWKFVTDDGRGVYTYYIDVDNIKKHREFIYVWQLDNSIEPGGPYGYPEIISYSTIKKVKVDCSKMSIKRLSDTMYSGQMGKGRVVFENRPNWEPWFPKQGTIGGNIGYALIKFACDNAK